MKRFAVSALLALLVACGPREQTAPPTVEDFTVSVRAQPDGVVFVVRAAPGLDLPAGVPVEVQLATPAGPVNERAVSQSGPIRLTIPYRRAGVLPYQVRVGDEVRRGELSIEPGVPVELAAETDPRAVRVVGGPQPLVIVQPLDLNLNVVEEAVPGTAYYPRGEAVPFAVRVRRLIGWARLPSGTEPGLLHFSVRTEDVRRELGVLDLLPGPVEQAELTATREVVWADGRGGWQLMLRDARDALGNPVVNGAAVTFIGESPDGAHFVTTLPVVAAQRPLDLGAPGEAGRYRFYVQAQDFVSEVIDLRARAGLPPEPLPLAWSGRTLIVGPLLTERGALPDTGTSVTVQVLDAQGNVLREDAAPVIRGVARYPLPALPDEARRLRVQVLGREASVTIPRGAP